jgi:GH25 family lysozyme M1 (1,4-beta-N-acetylmuramidase)
MKIQNYLLIILLSIGVFAINGIDISQATSTATYTCLKNLGYSFAIIRAYRSTGTLDPAASQNLQSARAAGLSTEVYMFPCRGKNATSQVNELIAGISSNLYSNIWIEVENNPSPGCSWTGYDRTSNCNFVTEAINAIKAQGKYAGIFTSATNWQSIFGSSSACPSVGSAPLWYAHYDHVQEFSDFKPFGGWSAPSMKQFASGVPLCGADVDKNWYP